MSVRLGSLQLDGRERNWWAGWLWAQSEYGTSGEDSLEGDEGQDFLDGFRAGFVQRVEGVERITPAVSLQHAVYIKREGY